MRYDAKAYLLCIASLLKDPASISECITDRSTKVGNDLLQLLGYGLVNSTDLLKVDMLILSKRSWEIRCVCCASSG